VESASPELTQWLARAPTVVTSLGSLYRYEENSTKEMLGAIEYLLQEMPTVQVLWKLCSASSADPWLVALQETIKAEPRIYFTSWILTEMAAVLAHKNVKVAVHHGCANSYHEAVSAGVPQVVLSIWSDLYDNRTRVVFLDI
jgi:UDP:flavonoid glycosyltransferase YjiC (YdhE family)